MGSLITHKQKFTFTNYMYDWQPTAFFNNI